MNSDKEMYSWNDRVVHIAHGKKHRIYFFRKSFDGCTTKNLKSLVIGITEAFENKYGVTYSPEVTEAIAKGFLDIVRDPLLNALFGGKPIDRSQILDFYEKVAVNDMSFGMAFVDLCIILGELERAMTFSRKVGKEYDLLKIVNETGGKLLSDVLRSHDMRMWLENAPQDLEHCRLNSMIFRAAQTASNEDQLRPLLELWGEGYYWDAFCLVRLMFPTSGCLSFMKENIPKLVNDPNCCVMERVLKSLHEVNNGPTEMQGTILDDCLLPHLDPLVVYRLVKLDITRNEKTSGELEKLTIRAKCAQNLRRVLLLSLVHGRPQQTRAMSADAVAHIKTFGGGALGDYFPVAERMLFQSCMEMICDAVSAVTYAAAPPGYATNLNLEQSPEQGIINVLFAHWRATNPQIWCDKFGRDTFHQFSTGLLAYHVTELEKVYRETESYHIHGQRLKYLKLALKLGWLFSSDEFDCEMDVFKGIIGLAENSDLKNQAVMLAEKFTHNLNGKSKTSSIAPIHITGEQLISNIKMQQIEIPPIPKNVVPAHSGGVPQESAKIETVIQGAAHVAPNPVFHPSAQMHQLPGQPVNVLSDDGVNMNGVLDEMETKWEAPAAQMAELVKEAAVDSVCHEEVAVIKDVSQNGVYESKQIIDSSTNERTVVEEERKPEPVVAPVVRAAEVPTPCAVVVPAQPIHVVQPPVVSASFVRPVAKRADFSDDGWGDSPDPSPSKPLPAVDDKSKDSIYQERVQRMMDNAKVIMENAAQVKESVAPQMAAPAVIMKPVVVPAPQPIQDVSIPPPSSVSCNNVLDALLEKKTAAGDAPSVEQPKEEHVEPIVQEAVSAEPREGIATSAAEMAQAAVVLPPTPVVASPVAPAPSPVSKPSTPYKTGGFEAMVAPAGEGGFGSFTGGGSMGGGSGQRGGRGGGFGGSSGGFGGQQNGGGGFQGGPQRGGYTNGRGNFNGGPRGGVFRGRGG